MARESGAWGYAPQPLKYAAALNKIAQYGDALELVGDRWGGNDVVIAIAASLVRDKRPQEARQVIDRLLRPNLSGRDEACGPAPIGSGTAARPDYVKGCGAVIAKAIRAAAQVGLPEHAANLYFELLQGIYASGMAAVALTSPLPNPDTVSKFTIEPADAALEVGVRLPLAIAKSYRKWLPDQISDARKFVAAAQYIVEPQSGFQLPGVKAEWRNQVATSPAASRSATFLQLLPDEMPRLFMHLDRKAAAQELALGLLDLDNVDAAVKELDEAYADRVTRWRQEWEYAQPLFAALVRANRYSEAEATYRAAREGMPSDAAGLSIAIATQQMTSGQVRLALETLGRVPEAQFVSAVRQVIGDTLRGSGPDVLPSLAGDLTDDGQRCYALLERADLALRDHRLEHVADWLTIAANYNVGQLVSDYCWGLDSKLGWAVQEYLQHNKSEVAASLMGLIRDPDERLRGLVMLAGY